MMPGLRARALPVPYTARSEPSFCTWVVMTMALPSSAADFTRACIPPRSGSPPTPKLSMTSARQRRSMNSSSSGSVPGMSLSSPTRVSSPP